MQTLEAKPLDVLVIRSLCGLPVSWSESRLSESKPVTLYEACSVSALGWVRDSRVLAIGDGPELVGTVPARPLIVVAWP